MKKLLLLFSVSLLATRYSLLTTLLAGSRVTQEVEAEIQPLASQESEGVKAIVTFTPPDPLSWGSMTIGEHLDEDNDADNDIYLEVTANNFNLTVHCDNTEEWAEGSSGHMNEYNVASSTYVASGRFLGAKLQWKGGDQTTYIDISSTDQTIWANHAPYTGDVYISFRQVTDYGDQVLPTGTSYYMILTYTVTQL